MKEQDRTRFRANILWFNQFFDGIRTLYELIVNQLPSEYFPTISTITSDNYYFPRQKLVPSIPPYYALLVEGVNHSLQILTIVDAGLIARNGFFIHEPSIISVVHTQANKNSWLDEFALNVIRNQKVELVRNADGIIWGHIRSKYPADFFAFQVTLDKFSESPDSLDAVEQFIIAPVIENLGKGFRTSIVN
jgi:hypothetical protein